jgi:hypothetical protein
LKGGKVHFDQPSANVAPDMTASIFA